MPDYTRSNPYVPSPLPELLRSIGQVVGDEPRREAYATRTAGTKLDVDKSKREIARNEEWYMQARLSMINQWSTVDQPFFSKAIKQGDYGQMAAGYDRLLNHYMGGSPNDKYGPMRARMAASVPQIPASIDSATHVMNSTMVMIEDPAGNIISRKIGDKIVRDSSGKPVSWTMTLLEAINKGRHNYDIANTLMKHSDREGRIFLENKWKNKDGRAKFTWSEKQNRLRTEIETQGRYNLEEALIKRASMSPEQRVAFDHQQNALRQKNEWIDAAINSGALDPAIAPAYINNSVNDIIAAGREAGKIGAYIEMQTKLGGIVPGIEKISMDQINEMKDEYMAVWSMLNPVEAQRLEMLKVQTNTMKEQSEQAKKLIENIAAQIENDRKQRHIMRQEVAKTAFIDKYAPDGRLPGVKQEDANPNGLHSIGSGNKQIHDYLDFNFKQILKAKQEGTILAYQEEDADFLLSFIPKLKNHLRETSARTIRESHRLRVTGGGRLPYVKPLSAKETEKIRKDLTDKFIKEYQAGKKGMGFVSPELKRSYETAIAFAEKRDAIRNSTNPEENSRAIKEFQVFLADMFDIFAEPEKVEGKPDKEFNKLLKEQEDLKVQQALINKQMELTAGAGAPRTIIHRSPDRVISDRLKLQAVQARAGGTPSTEAEARRMVEAGKATAAQFEQSYGKPY